MTEKSRRKFLASVPETYEKIAIVFDIPEETRHHRHELRHKEENKSVPPYIIENMKNIYQPPSEIEGFHEIIKIKG